jgi:hypothetical protein
MPKLAMWLDYVGNFRQGAAFNSNYRFFNVCIGKT